MQKDNINLPRRVKQTLLSMETWPKDEVEILKLELHHAGFNAKETARKQAKMIPLEIPKEDLEEWLKNSGKVRGLTTGYWTLDRMTAGLCGGDLDIIVGPTSGGKTLLCVNMMARQIASGYKVAFVTLEMSKREIAQRLYSVMTPQYYDLLMQEKPLLVQEKYRMPYDSIKYAVEQAKKWGAEVFYIDHLHYFSRSMQNQAEGLGMITQEFKRVAIEYDIPIILISQMRKTERNRPTGDDIRGSALIKQDADVVLILDKDEEHIRSDGVKDNVRVTLDKNRDRLIWKIGSETTLYKVGLDLQENEYSATIDAYNDVTGCARGDGEAKTDFGE